MNFLFRYKNKKKLENLYHTIEDGLYSDGIKERIKDLEYESNELQETIKKIENKRIESVSKDDISKALDDFSIDDIKDEKERELIVNSFIHKITYNKKISALFINL